MGHGAWGMGHGKNPITTLLTFLNLFNSSVPIAQLPIPNYRVLDYQLYKRLLTTENFKQKYEYQYKSLHIALRDRASASRREGIAYFPQNRKICSIMRFACEA
jgi:hypothetical protein